METRLELGYWLTFFNSLELTESECVIVITQSLRLCVEKPKRNNRNIHAHKRLPYRFGMVDKKYLFHF